jgi:hypothetical protein
MGLINWIFDIYQHTQIDKARNEAAQARAQAAAVRGGDGGISAERLERALGELALATKTLQRTLIDKGLCSADEFAAKLRQIDLEDGRADGRTPLP